MTPSEYQKFALSATSYLERSLTVLQNYRITALINSSEVPKSAKIATTK